mmetsp:Transcript_47104/g.121735  ORF Transcript_47104/g.121735 Transcript_47104/m.121735 type:complete len:91 (+) Transcript_47104:2248-2520(+)
MESIVCVRLFVCVYCVWKKGGGFKDCRALPSLSPFSPSFFLLFFSFLVLISLSTNTDVFLLLQPSQCNCDTVYVCGNDMSVCKKNKKRRK